MNGFRLLNIQSRRRQVTRGSLLSAGHQVLVGFVGAEEKIRRLSELSCARTIMEVSCTH